MIEVKARTGHVLRVADEAAADFWVSVGYQRVQDAPKGKPARKAPAKKAAAKSDK